MKIMSKHGILEFIEEHILCQSDTKDKKMWWTNPSAHQLYVENIGLNSKIGCDSGLLMWVKACKEKAYLLMGEWI